MEANPLYAADALFEKTKNLVGKSSGWNPSFHLFGDSDQKFLDAARSFKKVAQTYRRLGKDAKAGEAYERAAEVQEKNLKELYDAAENYDKASDAYRDSKFDDNRQRNIDAAIRCLERALALVDQCTIGNNANRMSSYNEKLGKIYEIDQGDLKKASEVYKEAATWIRSEKKRDANRLLDISADLEALTGDFEAAAESYATIIESISRSNKLMKYTCNPSSYYFKLCMCSLANPDTVKALRLLPFNWIKDIDSYKYKLIAELCDAIDERNWNKLIKLRPEFRRTSERDIWIERIFDKNEQMIIDDNFA